MSEPDIHALSGAYAVDALDDLERARFEKHLAACSECRDEVAGLREAAKSMSEMTQAAPPAALRNRVLAEIKTVRPVPPQATAPSGRSRGSSWARLAVAAAIVAVAGVGTVVVLNQDDPGTTNIASVADQVLQAQDARSVSLTLPKGAHAKLVRSVSVGKAVLITQDMPAAPDGKVYELWLQDAAGRMHPAGLMPAKSTQTVVLKGNARAAKAAGITVEPAGGSDQPTSVPVALFEFERAT